MGRKGAQKDDVGGGREGGQGRLTNAGEVRVGAYERRTPKEEDEKKGGLKMKTSNARSQDAIERRRKMG